jgi:hypothetical protein
MSSISSKAVCYRSNLEKIAQDKGRQALCFQAMQKCSRPMENCLQKTLDPRSSLLALPINLLPTALQLREIFLHVPSHNQ